MFLSSLIVSINKLFVSLRFAIFSYCALVIPCAHTHTADCNGDIKPQIHTEQRGLDFSIQSYSMSLIKSREELEQELWR